MGENAGNLIVRLVCMLADSWGINVVVIGPGNGLWMGFMLFIVRSNMVEDQLGELVEVWVLCLSAAVTTANFIIKDKFIYT